MNTQQGRGKYVLYDWATSKLPMPPKATDEQRQQAIRNVEEISAEMDKEPVLYDSAAEYRGLFIATAEEIMKCHIEAGGGYIPRHILVLMVYKAWYGVEIPADEEAARALARAWARGAWDRIGVFLQHTEAVERISSISDLR